MEFKSSQVAFKSKNNFTDDMKRFVIDEAARFTTDGNEAASASLDEMAEKAVRLSAEKNKRGVEEQKQILHEIKEKKKELKKESIHLIQRRLQEVLLILQMQEIVYLLLTQLVMKNLQQRSLEMMRYRKRNLRRIQIRDFLMIPNLIRKASRRSLIKSRIQPKKKNQRSRKRLPLRLLLQRCFEQRRIWQMILLRISQQEMLFQMEYRGYLKPLLI